MTYLDWLAKDTATKWWHDSADADELALALQHGATGVTTNPVLNTQALSAGKARKFPELDRLDWKGLSVDERSEWLTTLVVSKAARTMEAEYLRSGREDGYVCAQVNPALASKRDAMLVMARKFNVIGPNIAVKLPATAAGLDALSQCVSEGITCTATVSFTVAQVLAAAESHRRGSLIARKNGINPGRCFAVIMIGRQDDYLRDVIEDTNANVTEDLIRQAGIAVVKRAYKLMKERGYEARLCVAALRGVYHMTELAGADLTMSIHPKYQHMLYNQDLPFERRIDRDVPADVIDRLMAIPEFVRAYEPGRMPVDEFISYGLTQRTLSQFADVGWNHLATIGV